MRLSIKKTCIKQARKRANEVALAMERGRGSDAAQAAARAAAESAAKEKANGKAFQIDVSKLADFRYSKIKVGRGGERYSRGQLLFLLTKHRPCFR